MRFTPFITPEKLRRNGIY